VIESDDDEDWVPDWRITLRIGEEVDGMKTCPKCQAKILVPEYREHIEKHVREYEVALCPIDKCTRFMRENEGLIIRTNKRSDVVSDPGDVGEEDDNGSLGEEDMISVLNSDFKSSGVVFYTHPGVKLHDDAVYKVPHFRSFL